MKITVEKNDTVRIDDAEVLNAFSVDAADHSLQQVDLALRAAGAGHLTKDHAEISISYVLSNVGDLAAGAEWKKSFDGMVGYASSKGWVSDDGDRLVAHLENVLGG